MTLNKGTRPALLAGLAGLKGGGLDLLKLLAVVLMLGDHINTVFLGRENVGLYIAGRLVFPLFAIVYAANVRLDAGALRRAAARSFKYALMAQPVYLAAFWGREFAPWYGLNILFSFAVASWICALWLSGQAAKRLVACLVFGAAGALLEPGSFGFAGLSMLLAGVVAFHSEYRLSLVLLVVWWLLVIKITFFHWFLSLLVVVMLFCLLQVVMANKDSLSKFKRFMPSHSFYWIYAGHLSFLAVYVLFYG